MEADISDALILGIDFLRRYQCKIYLGSSVLEMGDGEKIMHPREAKIPGFIM